MEHTLIPKEEIELLKSLNDIRVVFDVGSRTDLDYYSVRPELEYHLFEPNPEFHRIHNLPNVILNKFGLGDREELATYYPKIQSFSLVEWRGNPGPMLPIKTLDSYPAQPDFLKIDTEGYDYRVLIGGREKLKRVKYIQFEYWDGVQKFVDLLQGDFDMFLIYEPRLFSCIPKDKQHKYTPTLSPLDKETIDLIDHYLIPVMGAGGNIFCKRK